MADKDKPSANATGDLKGLIFILFLITLAWFLTGGYFRPTSFQGPYLKPPTTTGERGTGYGSLPSVFRNFTNRSTSPTDSSTGNDTTTNTPSQPTSGPASETADILPDRGVSIYNNLVEIDSTSGARSTIPGEEYIVIKASRTNSSSVNITGWKIASGATGNSYNLGSGVVIFRSGQINSESAILLNPGERAIITTGRSPVGYSFKTNKCSGYLSQFQNFSPSIRSRCPAPEDTEIPFDPYTFNDVCRDYINQIDTCRLPAKTFPIGGGSVCNDFVIKHFHYNGCVEDYLRDSDFYSSSEWRIYLKRDNEIWKERREIIKLLDSAGNTVDISSY